MYVNVEKYPLKNYFTIKTKINIFKEKRRYLYLKISIFNILRCIQQTKMCENLPGYLRPSVDESQN